MAVKSPGMERLDKEVVNVWEETILKKLAEGFGGKAASWAGSEIFKILMGDAADKDQSAILDALNEIEKNQREILQELKSVMKQITWQTLTLEAFDAQEGIETKYDLLLSYAKQSPPPVKSLVDNLLQDIRDANEGVWSDLHALNTVIMGKDQVGQTPSLVKAFVEQAVDKQSYDKVSLLDLYKQSMAYLGALFGLQLKGLYLYTSALLQAGDEASAKSAVDEMRKRLHEQKAAMIKAMPALMHTLGTRNVAYFKGVFKSGDKVLYGDPPTLSVWIRDRHPGNTDEQWSASASYVGETWQGYLLLKQTDDARLIVQDGKHLRALRDPQNYPHITNIVWLVYPVLTDDWHYHIRTKDGKYLTASGNHHSLDLDGNPSDRSLWDVEVIG